MGRNKSLHTYRSMAVFVAILTIRYVPGSVLDGGIAEDIDVEKNVDTVLEEETVELVGCCCAVREEPLLSRAVTSPPAKPPPTAPPNTTSASTNAIQNTRVERPQIRCDDVGDKGSAYDDVSFFSRSLNATSCGRPPWGTASSP